MEATHTDRPVIPLPGGGALPGAGARTTGAGPRPRRRLRGPFDNRPLVTFLVVPALAVVLFAIVVPLGFSLFYSLTDWAGFGAYHFVGLENYKAILSGDRVFWRSLLNVLALIFATVFLQNPVAFALALLLSRLADRFSRVLRTVYFIPAVLPVVIIAKLWVNLFNPTYGLVNKVLRMAGLGALATSWLTNPKTALAAAIWIMLWQGFGWALLFYYAGLMTVPRELEEAARVDGASVWQSTTRIVIPFMAPSIAAVIVIDVISSLKQMDLIYLSTAGGPGQLTQFLGVYLYQKAFVAGEYGYGNALSVLFVLAAVGLTLLSQRLLPRSEEGVA